MKDKQRKPKTQSGFASLSSFSMHELAELIVNDNKPNQDDKTRTNRTHKQRTK